MRVARTLGVLWPSSGGIAGLFSAQLGPSVDRRWSLIAQWLPLLLVGRARGSTVCFRVWIEAPQRREGFDGIEHAAVKARRNAFHRVSEAGGVAGGREGLKLSPEEWSHGGYMPIFAGRRRARSSASRALRRLVRPGRLSPPSASSSHPPALPCDEAADMMHVRQQMHVSEPCSCVWGPSLPL